MYVTSPTVAQATGVNIATVSKWVKIGVLKPTVRANGQGTCHYFQQWDILPVAVARDLRRKGHSHEAVCAFLDVIER